MHELYVKQKVFKITDHYQVYDIHQQPLYQVDQDFRLFGNTVRVRAYNGPGGFLVNRKIISLMPHYDVSFADGRHLAVRQRISLFRKKIEVMGDDGLLELEGNFWDLRFQVYRGGTCVGAISKALISWGDTYKITVFEDHYEEILLALLIIVDDILDQERQRRNQSNN